MDRASPRPVPGRPALFLPEIPGSPALVAVSDLHFGLGFSEEGGLGLAESQARAMVDELLGIVEATGAGGVVIAGDAKHPIVGAPPPVGRILFDAFSTLLSEQLTVRLVPGNHDVGIARHLPREVIVGPSGGWRRGSVGLFHGHAWPPPEVLRAETLVAGHLHPGFRLASGPPPEGGKQRCWVRTELPPPRSRRRSRRRILARELLVLPAFNPLSGIESLNKRAPRGGRTFLVHRFLAPGRSRAYLLDGTDVGELPSWGAPTTPARAARAR
jgi:metallophosphoesterase superfamily enzyme